jgi:pilus assembly protein CpaF
MTTGADSRLVEAIRGTVLQRLSSHDGRERLGRADQRQLLRSWVEQELAAESRRRMTAGEPQLDRDAEIGVLRAVENTIWGLGRLQQLLDLADVEDIHIAGTARPLLRMVDGSLRCGPEPIADSDADLIAQLQYMAAHHGGSERAFSPAQPCLNMQLPDGSRLGAMRDVVPHPTVTIRRHRLLDVTLDDLVRLGLFGEQAARFLTALVRARRNVLVTGMPACGKTTLLRALCKEIPPGERVATLETEYELGLHRLPGASPLLVALETRPGSTEVDPGTGARAGEITLSDLLHQVLRMSVTRVIVGEVRGAEALPMLEAMNAGMPGSMCTLHAGSAADALERLVTAALKAAGSGWSDTFVTRLAAQGIDYVVHLRHLDYTGPDHPGLEQQHGRGRRRVVSEIAEVTDINEAGTVALNRIFAAAPGHADPRAVFRMAPQRRWPFDEAGVDLGFLTDTPAPTVPTGRNGRSRWA